MKTIPTILLATALVTGLKAQPAPTPVPAPAVGATTNADDRIRSILDRAYSENGATGGPPATPLVPRPTNPNIAPLVPTPAAAAPPVIPPPAANPNITIPPARPTNTAVPPLFTIETNTVTTAAPGNISPVVIPAPVNAAPATAATAATTYTAPRVRRPIPPPPGFNVEAPAPANTAVAPSVAGAVAPGAAGAAPNANAAAAGNPDEEVFGPGFIKFNDADLVQVLEIYQELTGRTVLKPNSLPATKINIRSQTQLTRREAIQALDSILSLNQITMIPQGDKFVKAVPQGSAFQEAGPFNDLPTELLPEAGVFTTMIYQLKNAVPNDVLPAIQPFSKLPNSIIGIPSSGILVLRDYAENVKRMVELLDKIDVVPLSDIENIVIPIKYALAADISQVLSSLTGGGGGNVSVGSSRQQGRGISGGGFGGAGGGAGGIGGLGGGIGGIGGQYNQNAGLGGVGGGAAGSRSSFQNRLANAVNRATSGAGGGGEIVLLGQTKIIADERTNSLLIFATKQDIETIKDIISKLDVVLAQVLIEAAILEVSLGDELNYGLSYLQKNPTQKGDFTGIGGVKNSPPFFNAGNFLSSAGTNSGLSSGLSYFARFGGDLEASLTAAAMDSNTRILSRPRIQTSHAVQCDLFIGRTRPYITGSYSTFGGGPQTQFQQQQIGITLQVLPLINQEGLVVMDIHQKIQDIGKEIKVDANLSVPETIDREANAKVAVRDRETIMLGGFISDAHRQSKSGVPLLKDIPILGRLFSANSESKDRTELVVLIRPTVLPTPQDAAMYANEERAKLSGTRAAEKFFMEQERSRQKKADKEFFKKEGFAK